MSYVTRNLAGQLAESAGHYPVVTVTGPRQSGKTTLCQEVFSVFPYVSLEPLDNRQFANDDPRGFLANYASGAVIDEIQHAPQLTSYLQEHVDRRPEPGRFVLTGSQHLGMTQAVTQSLAGRSAMLTLLPLSLDELRRFDSPPRSMTATIWSGGYPRIHDRGIPPDRWLADYVTTYLERDVRQVLNVGDLIAFGNFLRLAAGRTAQEVNLSAMGGDAGVSHNTARSWLSVLEATFVCVRLPSWHRNVRKRLVKAPKLQFLDAGLASHLLGVVDASQLATHPLRGSLFESWVASEVYKSRVHRGLRPCLHHYREARGVEVDLVLDLADRLVLTEVKSGATIATDWLTPLIHMRERLLAAGEERPVELRLVYGGAEATEFRGVQIVPWSRVHEPEW